MRTLRCFSTSKNKFLIETDELADLAKQGKKNLVIFNASYTVGDLNPRVEHVKSRIPNSILFDFNKFSCAKTQLSYMVPSADQFAEAMKEADVRNTDDIIVYDKIGMVSAPRAFWLLRNFGVPNVRILNGSFHKWQLEGRPIEEGDTDRAWKMYRKVKAREGEFNFQFHREDDIFFEDIVKISKSGERKIVDSRFAQIYQQGHIPNALSLPFPEVLNADKTFKSEEEIVKAFQKIGVQDAKNENLIFSCQRGITACILDFAVKAIGNNHTQVYDGSYEEYAQKIKSQQ